MWRVPQFEYLSLYSSYYKNYLKKMHISKTKETFNKYIVLFNLWLLDLAAFVVAVDHLNQPRLERSRRSP